MAIWAIPTLLAGVYGMSLRHRPELDWYFAYPVVLAVMVAICLGLYPRVPAQRLALTSRVTLPP